MTRRLLFILVMMLISFEAKAQLFERILGVNVCPECQGEGCFYCRYTGKDMSVEAFKRGFQDGLRMSAEAIPDGFHKITYENGTYEGYFKEGMRNGKGTYTYNDGEKYVGEWKNGMMHGKGTLITANKYKYTGEFAQNEMHGKGKLVTPDGTWYEGEFAANNMHGVGTLYIPKEKKYKKVLMEMSEPVQLLEEGTYNPVQRSSQRKGQRKTVRHK